LSAASLLYLAKNTQKIRYWAVLTVLFTREN
jgi:hypothetical protein